MGSCGATLAGGTVGGDLAGRELGGVLLRPFRDAVGENRDAVFVLHAVVERGGADGGVCVAARRRGGAVFYGAVGAERVGWHHFGPIPVPVGGGRAAGDYGVRFADVHVYLAEPSWEITGCRVRRSLSFRRSRGDAGGAVEPAERVGAAGRAAGVRCG
jgi:hypothetical protein